MAQKLTAALLLALVAPVLGQDAQTGGTPQGNEKQVVFLKDTFPFEGEVTVERLNVRLFARADAASIIATVLGQGEKIVVVGEKDEYYEIRPPRGTSVWIFARNVKKEGADAGIVLTNDAAVRMDSRSNAEKLATVPEGTKVKILKEHMGWYQIFPPDMVKYYVAKKYVKMVAALPAVPAVPGTLTSGGEGSKDEAKAKMREAEELAAEQYAMISAKQIQGLDFGKVAEAFDAAAALAKTDDVKREAEAQAKMYRQLHAHWVMIEKQLETGEAKINELKKQIEEKNQATTSKWDFTGYVDTVGALWNRPGSHKLMMADKIVAFVKTKDGDEDMRIRLNGFYGKYVGVRGQIVKDPTGWGGYTLVIVESVEELKK